MAQIANLESSFAISTKPNYDWTSDEQNTIDEVITYITSPERIQGDSIFLTPDEIEEFQNKLMTFGYILKPNYPFISYSLRTEQFDRSVSIFKEDTYSDVKKHLVQISIGTLDFSRQ